MLTQAINTPIVIPAFPTTGNGPVPSTQFLVQLAHPTGDFFPESTVTELNRDCCVNDIAGGVHLFPVRRVIAFEIGGRAWDASKEIAKDVLAQVLDLYDCEDIPPEIMNFLEDILGYGFVQSCLVEAAA